jgi:hypothetical protein
MANIPVTDQVQLTASVAISDNSALALAKLQNLHFSKPIGDDFGKPLDQFMLDQVELGVALTSPSKLIGDGFGLVVGGGVNATLSVYNPKHKTLFGDDEFAPALKINPGECWAGLTITTSFQDTLSATSTTGFGLSLKSAATLALGTFVHFPYPGGVIPAFKEGLARLLEDYSVPCTPAQLRAVPTGVAHTAEATGSIALGASYSVPLTINPLATLGLPFNAKMKFGPAVVASVKGTITLDGSFIVRTYRSSETKLVIGLYRKRETSLTAAFTTSAGVAASIGKTDVLAEVLKAVVPGTDAGDLHMNDDEKKDLGAGLKQCVDQSLSIALNAACTASDCDEAAIVYELDLSQGDTNLTDQAISSALRGDWAGIEALSNATSKCNIVRKGIEHNHKININLLGFYNATSITDYLNSTTVLQDEHGQISLVDKVSAKSLSAGTTPYAARADKLRSVLARDFIATVTYGAASVSDFSVHQGMLEYHAQAGLSDIKPEIALAKVFGFSLNTDLDSTVQSNTRFNQVKFYLDAVYNKDCVYRLFYQDVKSRTPYTKDQLDSIGRKARIDLLDPAATNSMPRLVALRNDDTWNAMNGLGNVTQFNTIPSLSKLPTTALGAISADWKDIRTWTDAMLNIAPILTSILSLHVEGSSPLSDPAFVAAHKKLEAVLAKLSKDTQSAYGDGWPLAVMYRVATSNSNQTPEPSVEMNMSINGVSQDQTAGPQPTKTKTTVA